MIGEIWAEGLNRLGDWNPQAFRELKGRLTPRTLWLIVGLAIGLQGLLLAVFALMLPDPEGTEVFSTYCVSASPQSFLCQKPLQIRWSLWWRHLAVTLSWILPYMAVPSVAFIAGNLAQEVQRGTLNVLRLSPQQPRALLQGKLWGVPSPVWLGGATVLPLYLWAAIQGQIPGKFLLSYGLTWGLAIAGMNTAAALFSLNLENQTEKLSPQVSTGVAIGAAVLVWMLGIPLVSLLGLTILWSRFGVLTPAWESNLTWFGWSLTQNPWLSHLWVWGWLGALSRSLHQAATARIANPFAPVPTKRGSYLLTGALTLLGFGFFPSPHEVFLYHIPLGLGGTALFFTATGWLQKRQTLIDWLRYRHLRGERLPLWRDLLWGDRSPWVGCLALNAALYVSLWLGWALRQEPKAVGRILAMGLSLTLSAIAWNALMQTLRLWAHHPRQETQMSILGLLILALPTLVVLGTWPLRTVVWPLWLALGQTWILLIDRVTPTIGPGVIAGIFGQSLVCAAILGISLRIWQRQGDSEWQRLAARETAAVLSTSSEKHHAG